MSHLEVRNLVKEFDENAVVKDISFQVNRGQIVGLLGESGSGKTTLLRLIAGLIDPSKGSVLLKKKVIQTASQKLIAGHADIKIVHQEYNLFPQLTVTENIAYTLRFYEKSYQKARVAELIALCSLEKAANRPAKLLSGGEKQRTAIACAIAEKPQVLLLDEPFAHIDLPNRNRLSQTIQKLVKQSGLACVFVTHDSIEALALSHRLGVLKNGELLQIDNPETIYQLPANTYVAELTGETNYLTPKQYEAYFRKSNRIVLENRKVLVRPEHFFISDYEIEKSAMGVVKQCIFCGSYYKVQVVVERNIFWVWSSRKWEQDKQVFLTVLGL